MFHHIGLRSEDPDRVIALYEAALAPLGIAKLAEGGAGFGRGEGASFWIDGASLWIGKARGGSGVRHRSGRQQCRGRLPRRLGPCTRWATPLKRERSEEGQRRIGRGKVSP